MSVSIFQCFILNYKFIVSKNLPRSERARCRVSLSQQCQFGYFSKCALLPISSSASTMYGTAASIMLQPSIFSTHLRQTKAFAKTVHVYNLCKMHLRLSSINKHHDQWKLLSHMSSAHSGLAGIVYAVTYRVLQISNTTFRIGVQ